MARTAHAQFISQFSKKEIPADMSEVQLKAGTYDMVELLVDNKLIPSKSEARRVLKQNGVKVDGATFASTDVMLEKKSHLVLQVGKRKFLKLVAK